MAKSESISELEQLRARLEEAEETLAAIRSGEVDALVVSGPHGEQIYTLRGADHSYRVLLEDMNEGAATLLPDGTVLYCNKVFAEMLSDANGKSDRLFWQMISWRPRTRQAFADLLQQGRARKSEGGNHVSGLSDGTFVPAYCSISPVQIGELKLSLPYGYGFDRAKAT